MSDESPETSQEKSTVLKHVASALFPSAHLAPWMSILSREQAMVVAGMRTIGDIAEELDRRAWLDKHPGEELPASMGGTQLDPEERAKVLKDLGLSDELITKIQKMIPEPTEPVEGEEEEFFRPDRVRGASGMFGYCLRAYADNIHDISPSIGGIARKQGLSLGAAHGQAGIAVAPKPRSLLEKVTFRGKDKDKVGGGI